MDLLNKILLERITDPGQLGASDQERVLADPALQAAIRENLALAQLQSGGSGAPERTAMLAAAVNRETNPGGYPMSLIERLFTGRRWYFQLGAAMLLLAAVTLIALIPRSNTWAETNGYVLQFDYGQIGDPDNKELDHQLISDTLSSLETAVNHWAKSRDDGTEGEEGKCEIMISVNVDQGKVSATVALADESREVLEELAAVLAKVDGVPTPTITDATWYHQGSKFDPAAGLQVRIMDHLFAFPKGASEEEIEQTMNDWLKANKPDFKGEVDVQITRTTDAAGGTEDERIEIMIKLHDDSEDKG